MYNVAQHDNLDVALAAVVAAASELGPHHAAEHVHGILLDHYVEADDEAVDAALAEIHMEGFYDRIV